MQKINRNYRAVFNIKDENNEIVKVITISYPMTLHFSISMGYSGANNVGVFQFYNLSYDIQNDLWRDLYTLSKKITMQFYAGYGSQNDLVLIFEADIMFCNSYRDSGSVDMITEIQTMPNVDMVGKWGFVNATFDKDTPYANVLKSLLSKIPNLSLGFLSEDLIEKNIGRSQTYIGKVFDKISTEFSNYNVFIDNNQLHIIKDNEILPGRIQVISEQTGMLGTPRVAQNFLEVDSMFEPGLRVGQLIYLDTTYPLIKSQTYKILKVEHGGTISGTASGQLTTKITLFLLNEYKEAKNSKDIGTKKEEKSTQVAVLGWIKPVDGVITSGFGKRKKPLPNASEYHSGIDIAANFNAPIKAPYDGTVINSFYNGGFGNYVAIDHGKNSQNVIITSEYGHLNKYIVKANQKVKKGDVIGYVGSTGTSTGNHLHFGIKENGRNVNPNKYVGY